MGKVKCLMCNEILESKYRHDFVICKCPNETFVDGGNDYCRYGGVRVEMVEVIQEETLKEGEGEGDMLRLTLEMVPKGKEDKKYTMAEIEISNKKTRKMSSDSDKDILISDYGVRLNGEDLGMLVKDFIRERGAYKLIQEVTAELYKIGAIE